MSGDSRSRIGQGIIALTMLGAAVMGTRVLFADPVHASPDVENGFVVAVNDARAERGLESLAVDEGLVDAAREWTHAMVESDELAHASDITLGVPPGWTKAGENVGRGDSIEGLMAAFIDSPGHRRNLLDPEFNRIGVGSIVNEAGVLYTTHRFAMAPAVGVAPNISHVAEVECPDGRPQVVLTVANGGAEPAMVGAWLGYQAEQTAAVEAGSETTFTADNQPPGETRIRLFVSGGLVADDVVTVSC